MDSTRPLPRTLLALLTFAAAVAAGAPPFAIATVDGGTSYWHPRPSGDDASAMVVDELLPLLADHGLRTDDLGLMGWSMGGYGALRLAGLLGPERVRAVVAASPAIWTDPDDASTSGFDDAEEYQQYTVVGHQGTSTASPSGSTAGRATRSTATSRTTWTGSAARPPAPSSPGGTRPGTGAGCCPRSSPSSATGWAPERRSRVVA